MNKNIIPIILAICLVCGIFYLLQKNSSLSKQKQKLVSVNNVQTKNNNFLQYKINISQNPHTHIDIELRFKGSEKNESIVSVCGKNGWGGISDCEAFLDSPKAFSLSGKPLEVKKLAKNQWIVAHEKGERIRFSYGLTNKQSIAKPDYASFLAPVISDNFIHFIGHTALAYPNYLHNGKPIKIAFSWNAENPSWNAASYGGYKKQAFEIFQSLETFLHGAFIAGELDFFEVEQQKNKLHFAFTKGYPKSVRKNLAEITGKIVFFERSFFADLNYPEFFMTFMPVQNPSDNSQYINSANLHNSFAVVLSENSDMTDPQSIYDFKQLVAHEAFHNWNGGKIKLGNMSEDVYWFSEGFTNHFARKLLFKSKLFSIGNYLHSLNAMLESYYQNPHKSASNKQISAKFYSNSKIRELPYFKGDLLAYVLDYQIRNESDEQLSIDDFMLKLVRQCTKSNAPISNEKLFNMVQQYTDSAFAKRFKKMIIDGAEIKLPKKMLHKCFTKSEQNGAIKFEILDNLPEDCTNSL